MYVPGHPSSGGGCGAHHHVPRGSGQMGVAWVMALLIACFLFQTPAECHLAAGCSWPENHKLKLSNWQNSDSDDQ